MDWIPVKVKLPDNDQAVLVCDKTGFITRMTYSADSPACWFDDHDEFFMFSDILAWMPLPDAYQGDSNE